MATDVGHNEKPALHGEKGETNNFCQREVVGTNSNQRGVDQTNQAHPPANMNDHYIGMYFHFRCVKSTICMDDDVPLIRSHA